MCSNSNINYLNSYQNPNADCLEKIGNAYKLPVTLVAGRVYTVDTFSEKPGLNIISKIFLATILLIFAPITISMTLLGLLFTQLSSTYKSSMQEHIQTTKANFYKFLLSKVEKGRSTPCPESTNANEPNPPFLWKVNYKKAEKPPEEYDSVRGKENTKKFMETEKDPIKIARMVQASVPCQSPLMDPKDFVFTEDIVTHATLEQIPAIMAGAADNRYLVSSVLGSLLYELNVVTEDSGIGKGEKLKLIEDLKEKLKAALKELSEIQLNNMIAVDVFETEKIECPYQHIQYALRLIPVKSLLKWKTELGLSEKFIANCERWIKYSNFVAKKAKEEPTVHFD